MGKQNIILLLKKFVELLIVKKSDVNSDVIPKSDGQARPKVLHSEFSFPGKR